MIILRPTEVGYYNFLSPFEKKWAWITNFQNTIRAATPCNERRFLKKGVKKGIS